MPVEWSLVARGWVNILAPIVGGVPTKTPMLKSAKVKRY